MANNSNKNIIEILDYHIKSKRFIGGLGRLKKDGTVKQINGQIFARKTNKRTGDEYIVMDNFLGTRRSGQNKRWQMVLVKNIIQVNENHWVHKRAV